MGSFDKRWFRYYPGKTPPRRRVKIENPKYLKKPSDARRYMAYSVTSAEYRIFDYDITVAFLEYVKFHAEQRGKTPISLLTSLNISPNYHEFCRRGKKICSFKYAMFVAHKVGEPITLVV